MTMNRIIGRRIVWWLCLTILSLSKQSAGTTCFGSCLGRTAKARDGTTARAAFRGWRSWCLSSLSRRRVKVSSTYYIIPVQTDTFLLMFSSRGWSFLTHVPTNVVTFGLFWPCFRFSSSKTKLLNCRLLAIGLGCVNPTRSKASLQFLCRVEMVGQEQRTAPDAAEQTEETERLRAAEAQAQQQVGGLVSS